MRQERNRVNNEVRGLRLARSPQETLHVSNDTPLTHVETIEHYIEANNDDPEPFVWTKTADEILASLARFCARTLAQADS